MSLNYDSENVQSHLVSEFAGIKLSSLQIFIDKCGGYSELAGLTTTDVYDLHWGKKANIVEFGTAEIFVSFSWEYNFLDVVAMLQRLFWDNPEVFIWIDLFAIGRVDRSDSLWSKSHFKHIVLMLFPQKGYVQLKRISCNSGCKCTFNITMSPADEQELRRAIKEDCNYAKCLAIRTAEKFQLTEANTKSMSNISFDSMDSNTFASLVKCIGEGFEMCCAIIRFKEIAGSAFKNISLENELMVKLKELGIHSLFHQKVIARNILIWRNRLYVKDISEVRVISSGEENTTVQSILEYSNISSQYPIEGIKLSFLNKFIKECGGRSLLEGLSTVDVIILFVKPLMTHEISTYCDYLKTIERQSVGDAEVYISHALKFTFLEVVDTLQSHFADSPDIFIWIDIFSKNTIVYPEVDDHMWLVWSIIKRVKHTVLIILSPWNHSLSPLKRIWILYEIFCTISEKCEFEIAFNPSDKYLLKKICEKRDVKLILPMVNCRNTTSDILSKIRILYMIENTVGFDEMNSLITKHIQVALTSLIEKNYLIGDMKNLNLLAASYEKIESYDDMNSLVLEYVMDPGEYQYRDAAVDTLLCMNDLAKLYSSIGNDDCALEIYAECLSQSKKRLRHNHPDTLQTINDLAALYERMERFIEALPLCSECLEIRRRILGKSHPDTLQSLRTLAALHEKIDDYKGAIALYIEYLAPTKVVLEPNQTATLQSKNDADTTGKDEDALNLRAKLFALRREVFGENLEDTLQFMKNMIQLCKDLKKNVEALFLLKNYVALLEEKCEGGLSHDEEAIGELNVFIDNLSFDEKIGVYDAVKSTVGVNGVHSIAYNMLMERISTDVAKSDWKNSNKECYAMAMRTLGIIRMNQGKFQDAESHLIESLSYWNELEVEKPMLKLQAMNHLALLYGKVGKYEEALDLFTECIMLWKKVLKQGQPDISAKINVLESLFQKNEAVGLNKDLHVLGLNEPDGKHPYIITLMINLALLKIRMGKYADALKSLTFCLSCRSELYGEDHPETLAAMNNLAELYDIIDERDKAKDLYEKSLNISSGLFNKDNPFKAEDVISLDNLSDNIFKYQKSLGLFTNYLSLRESVLRTSTNQSIDNLKDLCKNMGVHVGDLLKLPLSFGDSKKNGFMAARKNLDEIFHESTEILSRSNLENNIVWLAFVEEILRMKDPDPLTMVNNIAYLYMKLGRYDEALPLFTNSLAMREEVLGKKHPETLKSIRNLADLFKCMGRFYDALPLLHKYASLLVKLVGKIHPYVTEINHEITLLYNKIGDYDKVLLVSNNSSLISDCRNFAVYQNPSLNNEFPPFMLADVRDDNFAKLRHGFKYILSSSDEKSKHTSYVNVVCSTRKYIVSASDDSRLLVWEMINDRIEFRRRLRGHTGPIVCMYAMKDDNENILNQILSASHDGTIQHWDLDEGLCVQSIKHDDYSVNECLAVICNEKYIFKGVRNPHFSEKGLIHIFDRKHGGFLCELVGHTADGHTDNVRCFAMTSAYLFSGSLDKSIGSWNLERITESISEATSLQLHGHKKIKQIKCATKKLLGHTDWVRSLCCTKDELRLISGSKDMTVRIWDIETGETIQILSGLDRGVRCVCMSDDDKQIICGAEDNTIRTWDLETGCPIRVLRGHTDWVTSVCVIPGTDIIVSCSSDKDVILWDVKNSPILFDIPHKDLTRDVCHVSSLCQYNKNLLITCTQDQICVWDHQQQYESMSSRLFSDMMGAEISCICENKTNNSVIICCNYKTRGCSTVIELFVNYNNVNSRDYRGIINCICSYTNYIIVGFTQKNAILIKEFINDSIRERTINMDSVPLSINCVCVDKSSVSSRSSSSVFYIVIGSQSKDILVWKYDIGHITKSFFLKGHIYPVRCLTHCSASKNQMNHYYAISGSDDYTLKLWRLPTIESACTVVEIYAENSLEGHTLSVLSVICTEELIVSGSADRTIMIWSFNERNPLRTLIGHTSDVTGLQIPDANHLVSVSKDGTMKVWDLSVGYNVPSDVELQELILLRHENYGYYEEVTNIIESMFTDSLASVNERISIDFVKNYEFFSRNDTDLLVNKHNRPLEIRTLNIFSKNPNHCKLKGFLNWFKLRVKMTTIDLVPYSAVGEGFEMIPLVHWMSRQPQYGGYLMNLLKTHPELLYSRAKDGKTLFSVVVHELDDPDFTHHCLKILSSNLQLNSLEMMWHDFFEISRNESKVTKFKSGNLIPNQTKINKNTVDEKTHPLIDLEDIVQAFKTLGRLDIIRDGILSLQRAPDKFSVRLHGNLKEHSESLDKPEDAPGTKLLFWDSDSDDKYLVRGCSSPFRVEDIDEVCNRRWIIRKCFYKMFSFVQKFISSTVDRSEIMQVMYVPFPMRIIQRKKIGEKQHTSSLLLEACIEIADKEDDASVFESSALTAILTYKLKMFGWYAYCTQCLFCTTLAVHFGYYAFKHSKIELPVWWPILLFIHSIPVLILEFLPLHLSTNISLSSTGVKKLGYFCMFFTPLVGIDVAILWVSYDQPGSEYDVILNAIFFLIIFSRALNNLKYLHKYGLFVRMLLQVLGRMWSYILLLIVYFVGFATTFNILIPAVRRVYNQECGDTLDSDECADMKATTERFQYPVISGVTTYMTMMNTMGWESTAFNISSAYSIYAFIVLVCIFVFISNVALNITIALMNHIYDAISKNEHASCHLAQAQYVLRIERLLLYFGLIRHDNPKYFPRWILVVCPKTHKSKDDKKDQTMSYDTKGQSVCDDTKHPNDDNIHA